MIQVEQGSLGALEQDVLAAACRLVNLPGAVHHVGSESSAVGQVFADDRFSIERLHAVDGLEKLVLLIERSFETVTQTRFIKKIDHPDATALGFIRVGGADASTCGANAPIASLLFHRLVEQTVVRHGHVGRGGEFQPGNVDAVFDQHVEFAKHHLGINDGSGADQTDSVGIKNSRWNQVQLQNLIVHHDGVAGIDPALITNHDISGTAQQIRDFSFPFVTPLRTDDDNIGQRHRGPKPPFCTIRNSLRFTCLRSKSVAEL